MVESVEALTVDLFFSDTHSVTVGSSQITDAALVRYGQNSITAAMFPNGSPATGSTTSTVLSPNYDSGHIKFDDLEPFFGHLYQLCPTLPQQPKFVDTTNGEWLVASTATDPGLPPSDEDADQSIPIGFRGSAQGLVSCKMYLRHPSGVPKYVLDEAPETESGSATTSSSSAFLASSTGRFLPAMTRTGNTPSGLSTVKTTSRPSVLSTIRKNTSWTVVFASLVGSTASWNSPWLNWLKSRLERVDVCPSKSSTLLASRLPEVSSLSISQVSTGVILRGRRIHFHR